MENNSNNKKSRTAAQIIGPHKNKQAHRIFQDVINRWVEALTIEGKVRSQQQISKSEAERKYKSRV